MIPHACVFIVSNFLELGVRAGPTHSCPQPKLALPWCRGIAFCDWQKADPVRRKTVLNEIKDLVTR